MIIWEKEWNWNFNSSSICIVFSVQRQFCFGMHLPELNRKTINIGLSFAFFVIQFIGYQHKTT